MAPAQIAIPGPIPPPVSVAATQSLPSGSQDLNEPIRTVDGLVRHRARTNPHDTIVSYPRSGVDFVDYSMQQLDVFAYRVARHFQSFIPTRTNSEVKPITIALLGPSNFDYLVTMLALSKLGHTVLFLSTRISKAAIESLVTTTGALHLLADPRHLSMAADVRKTLDYLIVNEIPGSSTYDFPIEVHADTRMDQHLDVDVEEHNNIFIIHSSGSTGFPKPIYQPQNRVIANYATSMDMKAFITLPLYHNHGICNFFRAIYSGKSIHIYNADLPLTQQYLVTILKKHNFEIFYGVPYALKLLAETEEGMQLLKQLRVVMYGGSACPDTLGDMLVEHGVNLVGHYGATEVGQLMTSFRPATDKAWNYVRESPSLSPYLKWVPRGTNLYECTVLEGWPAKIDSNQSDGSYATKDLFEPHPTIEKAWKYIARLDDTIALVNGEKFNPVMMEGKIRSHKAVTETVIFGSGRPNLGVLVVPSHNVDGLEQAAIVDQIWPTIDEANQLAEAYARISKDMIVILPQDCNFPRTDKGSIIRQAFYKTFATQIENAYDQVAAASGAVKALSIPELEEFLTSLLSSYLPQVEQFDRTTDIFSLGVDSLQSIQMRNEILKTVDIGGNKLGQNVVFEYPSIAALSEHLHRLRTGHQEDKVSVENQMQELIERYSNFHPMKQQDIALTGATGSLGAHVLAQLVSRPDIRTVYCLVRAHDNKEATQRVRRSLSQRKLYHGLTLLQRRKIQPLASDLADPLLGLEPQVYKAVSENLASVIHCAWSVNFNKSLVSFEKDCVGGVQNLINLCLTKSITDPASFDFCSSVSTVARCPNLNTPEVLADLQWAQGMGYAQSKCVAEHMCMAAAQKLGVKARVLRVGQIVADTVHGIWNDTEAIPLIMQSAKTIGALPKLQESPSWTPVDVVAKAITEISLSDAGPIVANVTNSKTFSWTNDLLPALRDAGLQFDEVEPKEWVRRLRASNPDGVANPPIKLVDFFASKYDKESFSPSRTYETSIARSFSPALESAPLLDAGFVRTFINQFQAGSWSKSTANKSSHHTKRIVVLAGPCGSGKSTVAKLLSANNEASYIEGDELHTASAISLMKNGTPLEDIHRDAWIKRLKVRAIDAISVLGFDTAIISCSALRTAYRDQFRELQKDNPELQVVFVDLQLEKQELTRRMGQRSGHYMKLDMIESQLAIREEPEVHELDVWPVDAGNDIGQVVKDVEEGLQLLHSL